MVFQIGSWSLGEDCGDLHDTRLVAQMVDGIIYFWGGPHLEYDAIGDPT